MMQVERLGLARALTPPNEQPLQPQFADLTCDDEWLDDYFARAAPTPNISRSAIKNLKIDHARRTAIAEYDQQVSSSRPVVLLRSGPRQVFEGLCNLGSRNVKRMQMYRDFAMFGKNW